MKKIYITGIAGTGKTTVSEELQKRGRSKYRGNRS
jgi:broad-specificity NMP kinase